MKWIFMALAAIAWYVEDNTTFWGCLIVSVQYFHYDIISENLDRIRSTTNHLRWRL